MDLEKVQRHFKIGTLIELLTEPSECDIYAQKVMLLFQQPMHPDDKAELAGLIDLHVMAYQIWDGVDDAVGSDAIVAAKKKHGSKAVDLFHWAIKELKAGKTPETLLNAAVAWVKS